MDVDQFEVKEVTTVSEENGAGKYASLQEEIKNI
jgi:hypothetical protein